MKFFRILFGILLVSAAVVVVFGCLWLPRLLSSHGPKLQPQTVLKDVRYAIGNFHADYHRFPGQPEGAQPTDVRIESTGPLIECLIGQNKEWNPKGVKYMDVPKARDGKFGYIPAEESHPAQLVDLWGSPYVILFDTNGDGVIENPDLKNFHSQMLQRRSEPLPPVLKTDVAIFSAGKDKVGGTGDDLVSWRTWGVAASGHFWEDWMQVPLAIALLVGAVVVWFYPWRSKARSPSSAASP